MIETKPFRSPLFSGHRIRVRITGEVVNHTTGKVIALVSGNPKDRRVISFEHHEPNKKAERTEFLTKFIFTDFAPLIDQLRKRRDAQKAIERASKQAAKVQSQSQDAQRETLNAAIAEALTGNIRGMAAEPLKVAAA